MDVLQLKDPGSKTPGYELDDLVDEMEDAYSKLSDLDHHIPLEEVTVSLLSYTNLIVTLNLYSNRRTCIVQ